MNLYKIFQNVNEDWDTYDSAVVAAKSEEEARLIHPDDDHKWDTDRKEWYMVASGGGRIYYNSGSWVTLDSVGVELIGKAVKGTPSGVIVASFNAG
jgi:hypothetical protein